ncbi:MAG: hypothetical protein ACHQFW_06885 [Chitinophagales bacterium]
MTTLKNRKNILPIIIALVVFFLFSAIYFYPLLQGKILIQSDVINHIGTSKEANEYFDTSGETVLWTNSLFGGMPTYQLSMQENGNLFEKVIKYLGVFLPRPANYMFIALVCFFIFLRSFKINNYLAFSGALCYALGTYLITFMEVGHNTKVASLALMPLVLTGINYLLQKRFWLGATITLFAMTCEITANHPQITYYMFLLILCWMISEFIFSIGEKKLPAFFKTAAVIILSVGFAVLANTSRLWTTYEYSKETIRGGSELSNANHEAGSTGLSPEYAFSWSSGLAESFSIMYSNFAGGGSGFSFLQNNKGETNDGPLLTYLQNLNQKDPDKVQELMQATGQATKYWGDMPFTSGPIYVGSILCFLFLLGALLADKKLRWWLIAATLLSLFLGWGKNFPAFNNFMFYNFPLYNKFRTVSMAMTILCLTIPVMAFYIVNKFLSEENDITREKKFTALKWSALVVGGLSLLLLFSPSLFDLTSPREELFLSEVNDPQTVNFFELLKDERASMIRTDIFVSAFFIGLVALTLFLFLKKTISKKIAIAVICILPVLDLLIVDSKYLGKENYAEADFYEKRFRQANPVIKDNDPDFRVWNTLTALDQDGMTSYYYKSLGGYHGAKLQRYQDLIDGYLSKGNIDVVNMLNTKYVITNRGNKTSVERNPRACGNAWFVDTVVMVKSADEEFASLEKFNPREKVFVNEEFKSQIPALHVAMDSARNIKLTKYSPNEMTYQASSNIDGPAVFSEIWYRGNEDWKAYIDGKYTDHFRANYAVRGLWIPQGEHEIVFKFEPRSFYSGKKISGIFSGLVLILVAGGVFITVKKEKNKNSTEIQQ